MTDISQEALIRALSIVERACTCRGRETLEDGLSSLIQLTRADEGFVVEVKPGGAPEIRLSQGPNDSPLGDGARRVNMPLVLQAIKEDRVVLVPSPPDEPSLRSLLVAPMVAAGDVLGATVLHRTREGNGFADAEKKILQRFVLHLTALLDEIVQEERQPPPDKGVGILLGKSEEIDALKKAILKAAPSRDGVLVLGETGVGKELVAQAIHESSPRGARPLVARNCAEFPEDLLESELFGHEEGAFTGAVGRRPGAFRTAHGTTLFLDEVGEMSLKCQAALLRVIQEGEVRAVGSDETESIDVRIVAATNRDLEHMVKRGKFREDLLHRLNGFTIGVPPLRSRRRDIPLLATRFLGEVAREDRRKVLPTFTEAALRRLREFEWPGNVRQLRTAVRRGFYQGTPETIDVEHLGLPGAAARSRRRIDTIEPADVARALREAGGKSRRAAKILRISKTEWYEMLKRRPDLKRLKERPDTPGASAADT